MVAGFSAILLRAAPGPSSAADEPLRSVWREGIQGRFDEASAALPTDASGEDARFTRAVLLFNRQPRRDADLVRAAELLDELATHGTTAELRARSRYFQAVAETLRAHDEVPRAAQRLYEQLWHDYPDQSYGQRALVHLLLLAFDTTEPRETMLTRCAEIERQAAAIADPVVRSQFHQVAARGYLQLGGADARALEHLLTVSQLGVARREAAGDLHVSIGELATELGRPALAREHYEAFLHEFPRDPRAYTIRSRLAALPAVESGKATPSR